MDRAIRWMRRLSVAVLFLGVALHLAFRDRHPGIATVFYGLPLPILTAGWLGLATVGRPRCVTRVACLLLAVVCGIWWYASSFQHHRPAAILPGQREVKVLFWNLAHRPLPHAELARLVTDHEPDIAGFVETGRMSGDPHPLVDPAPPGYQMLKGPHGTAVMVRGTAQHVRTRKLPSRSKYVEMSLNVDGNAYQLFIVDGVSSPLESRQDVLEEVLVEAKDRPRTLIMGDFNTPRESAWLDAWRKSFHHAFDEAGSGWSETWPRQSPVALLSIDHVWSSRELLPLTAARIWSPASDHAALLTTFRVGTP